MNLIMMAYKEVGDMLFPSSKREKLTPSERVAAIY
jgi:hypothetical protein